MTCGGGTTGGIMSFITNKGMDTALEIENDKTIEKIYISVSVV